VSVGVEYDHKKASRWLSKRKCEHEDMHTPSPRGYLQWHEWAEEMNETQVQRRCPGCTLFEIWEPRA
jgi:hypothetical protein